MLRRDILGTMVAFAGTSAVSRAALAQRSDVGLIDAITKRGTLVVGAAIRAPWAMPGKDGALVGFAVDVVTKLASDMDVDLALRVNAAGEVTASLLAGDVDIAIDDAGGPAPDVSSVILTSPFAYSGLLVVLARKQDRKMMTLADLDDASMTFALLRDSPAVWLVQAQFPKANILLFDDELAVQDQIANGGADAAIAPEPGPRLWVHDHPGKLVIPIDDPLDVTAESFALRAEDRDAQTFLNIWIRQNWQNDFLKNTAAYWLRGREWVDLVAL